MSGFLLEALYQAASYVSLARIGSHAPSQFHPWMDPLATGMGLIMAGSDQFVVETDAEKSTTVDTVHLRPIDVISLCLVLHFFLITHCQENLETTKMYNKKTKPSIILQFNRNSC